MDKVHANASFRIHGVGEKSEAASREFLQKRIVIVVLSECKAASPCRRRRRGSSKSQCISPGDRRHSWRAFVDFPHTTPRCKQPSNPATSSSQLRGGARWLILPLDEIHPAIRRGPRRKSHSLCCRCEVRGAR